MIPNLIIEKICLGYEALNKAEQELFYYAIAFIGMYVLDFLQWCSGTSAESAVWQPLAHGRVEVINKKAKDLCCKVNFSNMFHKEDGKCEICFGLISVYA